MLNLTRICVSPKQQHSRNSPAVVCSQKWLTARNHSSLYDFDKTQWLTHFTSDKAKSSFFVSWMMSCVVYPHWASWTKCLLTYPNFSQSSLLPQAPKPSHTPGHFSAEQLLCSLSWELADLRRKCPLISWPLTPVLIPLPLTWLFLASFTLPCKRKAPFLISLDTL